MQQTIVNDNGRFNVTIAEQFFNLPYRKNSNKPASVTMTRQASPAGPKPVRRGAMFRVGKIPPVNIGAPKAEKQAEAKTGKRKPKLLAQPRRGKPDDLKKISGLGPVLEETLNELGVYHFDQIAGWDEANLSWIEDNWGCGVKVKRDDWVAQAKKLTK